MKHTTLISLGAATLIAAVAYLFVGRPMLPDQPYSAREAEIASRPADDLSRDEMLARLQMTAREQPDSPEPQYFIGVLLRSQGQTENALRAFQSALRRDPDHVPALIALADAVVTRDGGIITEPAARLYDRAWRLDNSEVRASLSGWRPGRRAGALGACFCRPAGRRSPPGHAECDARGGGRRPRRRQRRSGRGNSLRQRASGRRLLMLDDLPALVRLHIGR